MSERKCYSPYLTAIPYVSGYLIALGITKQTLYYSFFGIRLFSYLSVSEPVFLAVEDAAYWGLLIISSAVMYQLIQSISEPRLGVNVLCLIAFLLLVFIMARKNHLLVASSIFLTCCLIYLENRDEIRAWFVNVFNWKPRSEIFNMAFYLLLTTLFTWSLCSLKGYSISKGHEKLSSSVIIVARSGSLLPNANNFRDSVSTRIETNDSILFAGRIQEYTFLFETHTKTSVAIANSDIQTMYYKSENKKGTSSWIDPILKAISDFIYSI